MPRSKTLSPAMSTASAAFCASATICTISIPTIASSSFPLEKPRTPWPPLSKPHYTPRLQSPSLSSPHPPPLPPPPSHPPPLLPSSPFPQSPRPHPTQIQPLPPIPHPLLFFF